MSTEPRRPKLQFTVRKSGPVPIPPGQLGSDAELLADRLALQWERVANVVFTQLLHRIKNGPVYQSKEPISGFGRWFRTAVYVERLPRI